MSQTILLDEAAVLSHRDAAIGQMKFTRLYLKDLIADFEPREWTLIPDGASTHLLWQIGHIAVAQYGLMLFRQRGRVEGDVSIMPGWLRKNFGKSSQASVEPDQNPTPEELLEKLDAIHRQAIEEGSKLPESVLTEPADMPYAVYPMKLGALLFAPLHESIHIGQIGLLRRLLGKAPIR
jgi:hypothetical protein